jgi:hypothetical protein
VINDDLSTALSQTEELVRSFLSKWVRKRK